MGEFRDKILGKCKHTSFFIVNEAVGGLTADAVFDKGEIIIMNKPIKNLVV
jgi:hypothetical protein